MGSPPSSFATAWAPRSSELAACTWLFFTCAVSQALSAKGFGAGKVGNNDTAHVKNSQVQAASSDDLGAQAVAKELGGLPIVANTSVPKGSVRVVLSSDYTGPGSGLSDGGPKLAAASHPDTGSDAPPPSPILTAGSDHPECVN
jgi:hypothetical protein